MANLAHGSGGVLRIRHSFSTITHLSFEHNSADLDGGVIFMENACVINISQVICSGNKVKLGVGGVLNAERQTKVYVIDSKMQQNYARFCGAIFVGSGSVLIMSQSTVGKNNALESFGALCIHNNSLFVVSNSHFKENNGSTGASLTVTSSAVYLENCTLTQSRENKEVIMLSSAAELRLSKTTVFQTTQQYAIHIGKVYDESMTKRKFDERLHTYECWIKYGNKTLKSDTANFKQIAVKGLSILHTSANAETQYSSCE